MRSGEFWLLPGGGVKSNEDPVDALQREIWEETGLKFSDSAKLIWRRTHRFERGFEDSAKAIEQHERIYLATSQRFEPSADNNPDLSKVGVFHEFRWWSVATLNEAKDELFAPRSLPRLVQRLVIEGPLLTPITLDD